VTQSTTPEINDTGNQRHRKSTTPEINDTGNQRHRKPTTPEINDSVSHLNVATLYRRLLSPNQSVLEKFDQQNDAKKKSGIAPWNSPVE